MCSPTVEGSVVACETLDKTILAGLGLPRQSFRAATSRPSSPPEVLPMSPSPPGRLARLADLAFRGRRAVVAVWVAGLVVAFGAAGLAGDWSADYSTPGSESRAAADLLQERFPERNPETVDVVWQTRDGAGSSGSAAARPRRRPTSRATGRSACCGSRSRSCPARFRAIAASA